MYITGDISYFESRLHSLPLSEADLDFFAIEAQQYLTTIDISMLKKWNREFARRYDINLKNYNYYFQDRVSQSQPQTTIPLSYEPSGGTINWDDANGSHYGDLAFFHANADKATVFSIYLSYQGLESLTIGNELPSLTSLQCSYNSLNSLNVSGCTALEYLNCENNPLTSLNVSGLTALQILNCANNFLTSLNISGLTALQILICPYNSLSQSSVDDILSTLAATAINNGNCFLQGGANFPPSAAGLVSKSILQSPSRGWSVVTS